MRFSRIPVLMLGMALIVSACGADTIAGSLETVSASDAAQILETDSDVVVLDIRTPEEFASGRIEGSVNIDFYAADFRDQIAALDRDTAYVVYCRSGNRSDSAMDVFEDLGFSTVYGLDGGIVEWANAGLPISG